ncbi:52 kDa repressor of the inhibitor of the protein kinase-like [Mytilus galloprovincialis]|uniref:52 kDa repressor of the inhibitor of the protein kinase-like n=1 Tax=Mytilus galloprovincialis TaxID=29158 RepID=UPI003F7CA340
MLCADQIQSDIVARCNSSRYFAFLADEATDCSTKTLISLCVRFYDRMDKLIHEDFLGFAEGKKTTGEALSDIFLTQLEKYGIIIANMRAQGYDGAANMSGIHRGVQARVRERVPLASYVHCKAHNLNLAIVHACKEPLVRNLMDTVQAIAFAFDYSAKRLTSFKENLGTAPNVVKEEMGRRQKLKTLCETRWASRSDSLFTFLHAYSVVCDSLEDLEQVGDAKARSYRCSITKFDFIVGFVVAQAILQPLAPLSAILQTKDFDLIQAVEESKVVVEMLQRKRESDDDWDQLYNSAVTLADSVDVVPSMPRGATRQQHRVNVPAAGPKDYWKRVLFIPFIDHLLQELRDRLIKNEDRFVVQYLIPSKLENCSLQVVDRLFNTFTEDLPSDRDTFNIEVERWKARWSIAEGQIPGTLAESLNLCNVDLYPNIYTCLLILLTMLVTTATAERSFSVMRRVKTYLRSTMTTDRLSGLCYTTCVQGDAH